MDTIQLRNLLSTAAIAASLMTFPANAVPFAPHAPEAPAGHRLEMMLEMVDATDAQRAEIEVIRESYAGRAEVLHEDRSALHEQLEEIREAGAPVDIAALRPLAERVGDLMAEGLILRAQMRSDIAMVLTEEQRSKLERLHEMQPRTPRAHRPGRHRGH